MEDSILSDKVVAFASLLCPPTDAGNSVTLLCLGYLRNLSQKLGLSQKRNIDHVDVAGIVMQFIGVIITAQFVCNPESRKSSRTLDHPYNILILKTITNY